MRVACVITAVTLVVCTWRISETILACELADQETATPTGPKPLPSSECPRHDRSRSDHPRQSVLDHSRRSYASHSPRRDIMLHLAARDCQKFRQEGS